MNWTEIYRQRMGALAAGLGAIGMIAAILSSLAHRAAPIPLDYVNGAYRNENCGIIIFRNGLLTSGSISVHYTLEKEKFGLAALTNHLVGVHLSNNNGCRVIYDQSKYSLYLAFSGDRNRTVTLWDSERNETHDFTRNTADDNTR